MWYLNFLALYVSLRHVSEKRLQKPSCLLKIMLCILLFLSSQLSEGVILAGFSLDVSTCTPNKCLSVSVFCTDD